MFFPDNLASHKHHKPVVLLIGVYDGVHRGHQALIAEAKKIAVQKNSKTTLITFKTHPSSILFPDKNVELLMPLKKRLALLKHFGLDEIITVDFNKELAALTAFDFFQKVQEKLYFSDLVIGFNATIGSDQENNRSHIKNAAKSLGFNLIEMPPVIDEGHPISSSRIRKLLSEGHQDIAKKLLGHNDF